MANLDCVNIYVRISKNISITGTVTVTSMANLGKIVSNGPNGAPAPATVLLQGNAGNLILPSGVKQVSGVPAGGQVMVRQAQGHAQQSPVLVQLNSGKL